MEVFRLLIQFIQYHLDKRVSLKHKGDLTEIAPTILKYMDIAIPKEMKETKTLFIEED